MLVALLLAACAHTESPAPASPASAPAEAPAPEAAPAAPPAPEAPAMGAVATLEARSGSTVGGVVRFTEDAAGVKVLIEVTGATPGDHAVHVHEKGDCSAPDATSAGGHFNPMGHAHGAPDASPHHPGDFGNVTVGADGKGTKELTTKDITLGEGQTKVVGLAVIVHEKADDFVTQPTGAAGGRQACGIVKASDAAAAPAEAPATPTPAQ